MDLKTIYSKTGKGVLEIKNKAGKLSRDLLRVLTLIDGKSTVSDVINKSRLTQADIMRCVKQLEDGGYIKEFTNPSSASGVSGSSDTSYVDDLDFTASLPPGKRVYQSGQAEWRARESAERMKAEAEAKRKREDEEQRKKAEAERQSREEAARMGKIEAERKAKEAAALRVRAETERKEKQVAAEMIRSTQNLSRLLEAERKNLDEADRRKQEEARRRGTDDATLRAKEDAERRQREEAEEQRRREEEEARKKRDEEDRKRRDEDERRRRDEEDRKRKEEDEARRRDEEDRKRRAEEEARRREEEEARRREETEARRRREEEDRRREEEDRRRREDDERRRREEEDRRRREDEERGRSQAASPFSNFDLPEINVPSTPDSGSSFLADFERQQEMLRKQSEDEERARREADETRRAMERAEREEEARAEAERRAAEDSERRARMEREESERRARERKRQEEYENKIKQDEERSRRAIEEKQRQEQAKIENDRRAREEELTRKRKAAEESDRKRRELKALEKQGKVRSPLDRLKPLVMGVVVVAALAFGVVQFMPIGGYIPTVAKIASEHINEPVSIGSMKMSLLSGFEIKLENVKIGATQDVALTTVSLSPTLGSLFSDRKVIDSIDIDGGTVAREVLPRLPTWLAASGADKKLLVDRISLRGIKLDMREFELPMLNAQFQLGSNGSVRYARLETSDGKLYSDLVWRDNGLEVSIVGANFTPPSIGPQIELTDFTARGMANANSLRLDEWEARFYDGVAKGTADISWADGWAVDGSFDFARVEIANLLAVFTRSARTTGPAEGRGRFSLRSNKLPTLFDNPRIESAFTVRKGDLDGVDLVRALQSGPRGTQGGSTKFQDLSGELTLANGRYQYRNIRLSAGILTATGNVDIAPNQDVSGRVYVELRSQAQQMRANLNVTGSLKGVLLRP